MDEMNILCAEILLSKYFSEHTVKDGIPAKSILAEVKGHFPGLRPSEIEEASKRLNIKSKQTEGEYLWEWKNSIPPEDIWASKCKELFGG